MILLWLKNLVIITIFYVLISKKVCFLANKEGIKFENVSGPLTPTILGPPLKLNEKNLIFQKSQGFEILKLATMYSLTSSVFGKITG